MSSSEDCANDEVNITPSNRKKLCKARGSGPSALISSDSSDEHQDLEDQKHLPVSTGRSSERIRKRKSQEFHMPNKRDLWDEIPSTTSSSKHYEHLKPRKLVNNFTRENNQYNCDPYYTSGEDSSEDGFIVSDDSLDDDDEEEDGDTKNDENGRKKKKKIAGYRKRIKSRISESSSDEENESTKSSLEPVDSHTGEIECTNIHKAKCKKVSKDSASESELFKARRIVESDESNSDESDIIRPTTANKSVIVSSDSDSADCIDFQNGQDTSCDNAASNPPSGNPNNKSEDKTVDKNNVSETETKPRRSRTSSSSSSSLSSLSSLSSSSSSSLSESQTRATKQKRQKLQKFQAFQQARKTKMSKPEKKK